MSNIVENKTFEQKMKDRIKESIGDLITDDDLTKLVEKGLNDAFFGKRYEKSGYHTKEKPPLMEEIVFEVLAPKVKEAIAEWINKNNDQVEEAINKVVSDGAGMAVVNAFNSIFQNQMWNMQNDFANQLMNLRNQS